MISTTINTTASTNDNSANCVPMTIPNGAGVVHGKLTEKLFIPKTSTKNLKIHTFTIGVNTKGIKNTGFKTNGAPNKIGSFTPKNVGTTDALPIALLRLDLATHININGTTNVVLVT